MFLLIHYSKLLIVLILYLYIPYIEFKSSLSIKFSLLKDYYKSFLFPNTKRVIPLRDGQDIN